MLLKNLFSVVTNNKEVVVLKLNEGVTKLDLIQHPFFNGTEELIRITKGDCTAVTIFRNNNECFEWHWGGGSSTLVSSITRNFGIELYDYVRFELGIYMGSSEERVKKNLEQLLMNKPIKRDIRAMQWNGNRQITLHIDGEFVKQFSDEDLFEKFMKKYFTDEGKRIHSIATTGVNVYDFTAVSVL